MKLKIRDMEAETDKVAENNYLDLLEISAEFSEEEENQLFQWVRPGRPEKFQFLKKW